MKILILRFSSIGDIVLTTPVIRCVATQIPHAEIHYATKKSFLPIIAHNPYISKIHLLDNNLTALIQELKSQNFDLVIDLHKNIRTYKIKKALKVKSYSFNKLNVEKWLYTTFKINLLPSKHIVDRYFEGIKKLKVINDGKGLDYFIAEKDKVTPKDIPVQHSFGFIGLVIGAALNTKKLPTHKLIELCSLINYPIILLGGKEDFEEGEKIKVIDEVKIYNACGKFTLNESAHLVQQAKIIITHDTGLMHIAAAFKKPIISIWGNTVPAFGMYPYYGRVSIPNIVHQVNNLFCRPCSKIGYKQCPLGHFKCMNNQKMKKIADDVSLF